MIYPSITELSDEGVNRYMLSIATAKSARRITAQQLERNGAGDLRDDKFSAFAPKKQVSDKKPVKEAIEKLYTREYKIIVPKN